MPTVTYAGSSFECVKAIKGSNYIELRDANNCRVCRFDGVIDFDGFVITDGDWSSPAGAKCVFAEATVSAGTLYLTTDEEIGDGTLITFKSPCWASALTGLYTYVNGDLYRIRTVVGGKVTDDAEWMSGAYITLIADVSDARLYVPISKEANRPVVVNAEATTGKATHTASAIKTLIDSGIPVTVKHSKGGVYPVTRVTDTNTYFGGVASPSSVDYGSIDATGNFTLSRITLSGNATSL